MQPSAKGSVVVGVVASIRAARRKGSVSDEQLSARLSARALKLLSDKIEVGLWYPMDAFGELVELDYELTGSQPEAARRAGAQSADRMFDQGLYQQLEYAERVGRAETRDGLVRQSKLITTVTAALYSYLATEVRLSADGGTLEIVYRNAAAFPEPLRYSTEGYMNRVNERQGSTRRWTSSRAGDDEIVFRMALPGRFTQAS